MYQVYALKYGELILGDPDGVLTSDASHFYRNVERYQLTQLITSLPQMLAGFDTIHALAGDPGRIVAGHDPEVAARFHTLEPGIIQIA